MVLMLIGLSNGSKLEWNASEIKLAGQKVSITGKEWDNGCKVQKNSAVEMALTSDNSINVVTTHLYRQINEPVKDPLTVEKSGITTACAGSYETDYDGLLKKQKMTFHQDISIDNKYESCTMDFGDGNEYYN